MIRKSIAFILAALSISIASTGCISAYKRSIGNDTTLTFSRIYLTDFNTAWQAVLESLKNIPADITNREAGFIQTRWTDNTALKNFTDSFGPADTYLKSQFRLRVSLSRGGTYNGVSAVKITIQKDQLIQRDVLDGWRPVETDSIEENTMLYRIGRIVFMKMKLARIEEEKIKKSLENTKF